MSEYTCAVWYWSHGSIGYTLFRTEDAAADFTVGEFDELAPTGVQFADGRLIEFGNFPPYASEWPAYAEADRRLSERIRQSLARERDTPQPACRIITAPFGGGGISVLATEPDWLDAGPLPPTTDSPDGAG